MSTSRIDPKERFVPEPPKPLPLPPEGGSHTAPRSTLVGGLLWMVFGPMMLFVSTIALVIKAEGFFTPADIYYVLALGSMMAGRWLEFYSGGAQTSDGKPASARPVSLFAVAWRWRSDSLADRQYNPHSLANFWIEVKHGRTTSRQRSPQSRTQEAAHAQQDPPSQVGLAKQGRPNEGIATCTLGIANRLMRTALPDWELSSARL